MILSSTFVDDANGAQDDDDNNDDDDDDDDDDEEDQAEELVVADDQDVVSAEDQAYLESLEQIKQEQESRKVRDVSFPNFFDAL